MTDAHHHAAHDHERGCGKAELFGTEQRGNQHIAPGLQLTIDLQHDAVAQTIEHQHLLGLGQAQFPRHTGMLETGERRGSGAPVVAGDENDIGVCLGHACRDGAHAGFGHEFHVDTGARVGILQIEDELREVFDRVDVVMWWR